ncbi:ribosome maturation factor RimP [Flocculibacter collagenilyticus]|uniref:ribosome maturation factor RimP n=1 Tax=Flocculibacter collagenilyticus TaxID=2744479 RepID=UPI0018F317D1|nr:ribosome maturation factor RimP [Flocculibacter collagenilyticus]
MAKLEQQLHELFAPSIEALGFELLGIEFVRAGKNSTLRIYIESENGITVDDCAAVSHQVSGIMDVEDPISTEYFLEVSSPGADRPLFNLDHYKKAIDETITLRLVVPQDGRRKFKGKLCSVENDAITMEVDGKEYNLMISNIDKANIVPNF